MGRNLTNLYISQSFQFLTQVSGSELQNGLGDTITGSLLITASLANTALTANTASYVLNAVSASYATTASHAVEAETVYATQTNANQTHYVIFTDASNSYGGLQVDNSLTYNPNTNLMIVTASYSNAALSSSQATNANTAISSSFSATATSASYALTSTSSSVAINATSASYATNALSSSFAITASYALNAGVTVNTGSLLTTASAVNNVITFTKGDGSTFPVTVDTGSAVTVNTGSLLVTASISNATTTFTKGDGSTFSITANNVVNANSASVATTASYALTALSSSYALNALSASYAPTNTTGSFTGSFTGSLLGTASFATNALSASYAPAGSPFPFTGSAIITGSLTVIGPARGNVSALTVTSNTASLNCATSNFFTLQLTGSTNILILPTNIQPGQTINLRINTTGSGTVSFPTSVIQASGSSYTPTATTGIDIVTFISFDTSSLALSNIKNLV